MKATGIVRTIDGVGRFVIPKEIRLELGMDIGDAVEVFVDEDQIYLRKYCPACIFCNNPEDIVIYDNKKICKDCIKKLTELAK